MLWHDVLLKYHKILLYFIFVKQFLPETHLCSDRFTFISAYRLSDELVFSQVWFIQVFTTKSRWNQCWLKFSLIIVWPLNSVGSLGLRIPDAFHRNRLFLLSSHIKWTISCTVFLSLDHFYFGEQGMKTHEMSMNERESSPWLTITICRTT